MKKVSKEAAKAAMNSLLDSHERNLRGRGVTDGLYFIFIFKNISKKVNFEKEYSNG